MGQGNRGMAFEKLINLSNGVSPAFRKKTTLSEFQHKTVDFDHFKDKEAVLYINLN